MHSVYAGWALAAALVPAGVCAATDGHYCAGTGYLAMEFTTPKAKAPHVVKIARFDAKRGPRWAGQVTIDAFDTQGMMCGEDQVSVSGRAGGRWVTVTIPLEATRKPGRPAAAATPEAPADAPAPPMLGAWAEPGVTALTPLPVPGAKPQRHFQLQVTRTSRRLLPAGLKHQVRSVLEELDAAGHVKRSLVLFKGTRIEAGV